MFHFLRIPCSTSRIRCSTSSGIDVPLPPDSVFHFLRNTHERSRPPEPLFHAALGSPRESPTDVQGPVGAVGIPKTRPPAVVSVDVLGALPCRGSQLRSAVVGPARCSRHVRASSRTRTSPFRRLSGRAPASRRRVHSPRHASPMPASDTDVVPTRRWSGQDSRRPGPSRTIDERARHRSATRHAVLSRPPEVRLTRRDDRGRASRRGAWQVPLAVRSRAVVKSRRCALAPCTRGFLMSAAFPRIARSGHRRHRRRNLSRRSPSQEASLCSARNARRSSRRNSRIAGRDDGRSAPPSNPARDRVCCRISLATRRRTSRIDRSRTSSSILDAPEPFQTQVDQRRSGRRICGAGLPMKGLGLRCVVEACRLIGGPSHAALRRPISPKVRSLVMSRRRLTSLRRRSGRPHPISAVH